MEQLRAIRPFEAMEVFRDAARLEREGRDVVHLSLGQPGAKLPPGVTEALQAALASAPLGYTEACGLDILREKIAAYYQAAYGLAIAPERVMVTTGSSAAFYLSLLAAFQPGDHVAIASPYYPAYPNMLEASHLETVVIETDETTRFQPTVTQLEQHQNLKGLVIASPANPTGAMLHREELAALISYAQRQNIQMISDEIYHGITYDAPAQTALAYSDEVIVINSFSKFFLLPGWRLGWAVVPAGLARRYECLLQSFHISPPTPSQLAAQLILDQLEYLHAEVVKYAANREILHQSLVAAGCRGLGLAEGAFYLYADIRHLGLDSRSFCHRLLYEAGVAAVPGTDFDPVRGDDYVRFSYAGETPRIAEAARRISAWRV